MTYSPDIHHRRSIRLRGYDYAASGTYFVTLCAHQRECLFGSIADGESCLNDAGLVMERLWLKLPERFPDVVLDEYVVMPNHFHGIIVISDRRGEPCVRPMLGVDEPCVRPMLDVDEPRVRRQPVAIGKPGDHKDRPYGTQDNSVGRIVQAFKSLTTVEYVRGVQTLHWQPFPGRLWQRNYYERVIRNQEELESAREYIAGNPMKWAMDEENPANTA